MHKANNSYNNNEKVFLAEKIKFIVFKKYVSQKMSFWRKLWKSKVPL